MMLYRVKETLPKNFPNTLYNRMGLQKGRVCNIKGTVQVFVLL